MAIELRPGTTLAEKYRIERLLGRGAVGAVYAAEHLQTNKRVALKCVDLVQAFDPASAERLLREAQAAARIRHPNVVDIYDVGHDGKLVFLVMEYLEGEPLSCIIARREVPVHRFIALLLPAMRGVAEAHRQGVLHRDIKPENIFLARQLEASDPLAKVLDFGISKLDARGRKLRTLTGDGYVIGTPGYMAYEQALGDRTVDGRVDVYAFGAILYEALTGKVPHDAEDFPSLVRHFVTQQVVTPIELRPDIPRSLSALVMWTIERERNQRVPSMDALIRELEPFASERSYRAEQSAAVVVPERGRTLAGPWRVAQAADEKMPLAVGSSPAGASPEKLTPALPGSQADPLWLRTLRQPPTRRTLLTAAALFALAAFSLFTLTRPRRHAAGPTREVARHAITRAQAGGVAQATAGGAAGSSGLMLAEHSPSAAASGSASAPVVVCIPPATGAAPCAAQAASAAPERSLAPLAPAKPRARPQKLLPKPRDFGIY